MALKAEVCGLRSFTRTSHNHSGARSEPGMTVLLFQISAEKASNGIGNFAQMGLQREVAGVIEVHFRVRNIAPESGSAGLDEGLVVLAPHDQHGRVRAAQISLEFG